MNADKAEDIPPLDLPKKGLTVQSKAYWLTHCPPNQKHGEFNPHWRPRSMKLGMIPRRSRTSSRRRRGMEMGREKVD